MTTYGFGIAQGRTLVRQPRVLVQLIGLLMLLLKTMAANPFAENVRPTEALTPELEQKSFHLPPGFEIQLVAAEPDIAKPMNLAFDATGRLWVTTSREYPFPAPPDKAARDRIMIFEDFGPDGRARKVTKFADGLNIPIGVYPFRSASTLQPFNASTNGPSKGRSRKRGSALPGPFPMSGSSKTPTATAKRTKKKSSTARSAGNATPMG